MYKRGKFGSLDYEIYRLLVNLARRFYRLLPVNEVTSPNVITNYQRDMVRYDEMRYLEYSKLYINY